MATTPTNKPIPSEDPRDLKFNAGKIDEVVNSGEHYYTDRFGVRRWTIAGFQYTAEEAIRNYGYITMDSFEDGATLTLHNQVLRYEATGEYYRWDGEFPKTVPVGSTPSSTGGIGFGAWVSVGDASLRSNLKSNNIPGTSLITHSSGLSLEHELNNTKKEVFNTNSFRYLPNKLSEVYSEELDGENNPQGFGESENYYFVVYDAGSDGYVSRINKVTLAKESSAPITTAHGQGILVENDDVVYISHSNGNIIRYTFSTGATQIIPLAGTSNLPTGFKAGQPFCWDGVDLIYQLDVEGDGGSPDGSYDQIRVYSLSAGAHQQILPLQRDMVKEGTVQGIQYHKGMLYLYTGGSYSGVNDSNQNVTSVYIVSLGGRIINSRQYYAATFAAVFKNPASSYVYYEAQGISVFGGNVTLMFYAGTRMVIAKQDDVSGNVIFQGVNSTSYIWKQQYTRLQDLRLSPANLSSASDVFGVIANSMPNVSELFVSIDSTLYPAVSTACGITSGNLTMRRYNQFRVDVIITGVDATGTPCMGISWVSSGVSMPIKWVSKGLKKFALKYDNANPATNGNVTISGTTTCDTMIIHLTHNSANNPAVPYTFTRNEIDFYIENSTPLYMSDFSGSISFIFTSTGINITGATGNAIIRRVICN